MKLDTQQPPIAMVGDRQLSPMDSDWPLSHLLDELWLRCRREVIHAMERTNGWLPSHRAAFVGAAHQARGEQLERSVVLPLLSAEEEHLWRHSPRLGLHRRHLEHRTALALAFGPMVLSLFAPPDRFPGSAPATDDEHFEAASALLTYGTSLIESLLEEAPEQGLTLVRWLDLQRVGELCAFEGTERHVAELDTLPMDEVRVVLRIVLGFFQHAQALREHLQSDLPVLRPQLERCFIPEIITPTALAIPEASAEARSSLMHAYAIPSAQPFAVLGVLGHLRNVTRGDLQLGRLKIEERSTQLGELFALLDDLVELVDDARSGTISEPLAARHLEVDRSSTPYATLNSLLTSSAITHDAERIATIVQHLRRSLARQDDEVVELDRPSKLESLLFYVRNWLE